MKGLEIAMFIPDFTYWRRVKSGINAKISNPCKCIAYLDQSKSFCSPPSPPSEFSLLGWQSWHCFAQPSYDLCVTSTRPLPDLCLSGAWLARILLINEMNGNQSSICEKAIYRQTCPHMASQAVLKISDLCQFSSATMKRMLCFIAIAFAYLGHDKWVLFCLSRTHVSIVGLFIHVIYSPSELHCEQCRSTDEWIT